MEVSQGSGVVEGIRRLIYSVIKYQPEESIQTLLSDLHVYALLQGPLHHCNSH